MLSGTLTTWPVLPRFITLFSRLFHQAITYLCTDVRIYTWIQTNKHAQTCTLMRMFVCVDVWGLTFLYICQMSWYWIGKITKRRGFSRSKGSNEGSKGAATLSIIVRVSLVLLSLSSVVTDILRTLLMFSVRIFLLGLYTEKQKPTYK